MNTKATILDLDALMDTDMGSVEAAPDFIKPAAGTYILDVTKAEIVKSKPKAGEEPKAPRIVITYSIAETLESDEAPFPNGSLFSEGFQATEDGLGYFKKQAGKLLNISDMNGAKLRDILEGLLEVKGVKCVITVRKSKGDNGQEYENINVRPVHESPAA